MVSYQDYEQMMRERILATHCGLVQALGQEAERRGITEEQLLTELEETKKSIFQEKCKKPKSDLRMNDR